MHGKQASVDFYINSIAPYKGMLEEWFVENKSIRIYFLAICITTWAVIFPNTKIVWSVFKNLPKPPTELEEFLK